MIRALALLCAVVASGVIGCKVTNEDFCCLTAESCAAVGATRITTCSDPLRPYCDGDRRTCIPDPLTNDCTGPEQCTTPARPVCDVGGTGTCVTCTDAADCTRFPTTPLCDADGSGECVACLSPSDCASPTAPYCDQGTHVCRGCGQDGECPTGLCDEATGACVAASQIVYVDVATGSGAACTMQQPCATIAAGRAAIGGGKTHVKVAAGEYREPLLIDGKTVTIVAPGASLSPVMTDQVPLTVRNRSTVRIEGLRVTGTGGNSKPSGVSCQGQAPDLPTLALSEVTIDGNRGFGVLAVACNLTVERARVLGNFEGGLSTSQGEVTVRNTFIARNGTAGTGMAGSGIGGVSIANPTALTFEFNTLADNNVATGLAAGVQCTSAAMRTLVNNIIVGAGPLQVFGPNCNYAWTLSNQSISGANNTTGTPTFVNPMMDDFHLATASAGIDGADPAATLATDIDGQPRPQGGRADLGADEAR